MATTVCFDMVWCVGNVEKLFRCGDGDDRETTYKDHIEEWTDYFVPPGDYDSSFEEDFQVIEMAAGLRKKASVARPRTRKGER